MMITLSATTVVADAASYDETENELLYDSLTAECLTGFTAGWLTDRLAGRVVD